MARIFRDSGVLNQFGSPSINSNTLANRPAFGQRGRLFISTDTLAIFRDTGTAWDNLTDNPGNIGTLEEVTTNGNTSTKGIFLGASGSLTNGLIFEVSGYTRMQQTVASNANLGASNIKNFTFQTSGTTVATGNPSPDLNQLFLDIQVQQTVGGAGNLQIGAGLFENVLSGIDNLSFTVSQTVGISALAPIISYQRYINTGDSNISHTAGLVINGLQRTGSGTLAVTNNYQLLINSSQQFATTSTVTNRWGIYQAGANDYNYFAGRLLIGTTTAIGSYDIVTNNIYTSGIYASTSITSPIIQGDKLKGISGDLTFVKNDFVTINATMFATTGNLRIGTGIDSTRKLQVVGEQEWITTTATGTHTTSGNHLPIWVNGVQYWLALLNPPVLP
jgi:hypothetical protein